MVLAPGEELRVGVASASPLAGLADTQRGRHLTRVHPVTQGEVVWGSYRGRELPFAGRSADSVRSILAVLRASHSEARRRGSRRTSLARLADWTPGSHDGAEGEVKSPAVIPWRRTDRVVLRLLSARKHHQVIFGVLTLPE